MKNFLIVALAAFLPLAVSAQTNNAQRGKVVVISLDGFPASALEDPKLPIPTLRKLIASGTGGPMLAINPTITWPNHTAMVTGVGADTHGLLVNGAIVRTGAWPPVKADPTVDKVNLVKVPTVYDAAHQAGLTTAEVDWVAIKNAPTINWSFPEAATPDGAVAKEMVAKGVATLADVTNFSKANIVFRDQMWTRAAAFIIREHKPDLMLFHLLALDSTQHRYGPGSLAAQDAMAFLDSCVEKIVDAVRDAGLESQTTILVVSDHGFKAFTKQIRATNALAAAGLDKKVYVLPEGGAGFVYIEDPSVTEKTREVLGAIEGVEHIYAPADYAALGLPRPDQDPQFGQLFITAKTGYSFAGTVGGPVTAEAAQTGGSHAYLASDPALHPIFIASGRGVRQGVKLGLVVNLDVASTIAKLLGVSLPTAKGKPLPLE
jgi:predicted AlkP superfamily pyrophosphatase or phosphodiesterase